MPLLQPKWGKGSHMPRFNAIRPYVEGKRVLDIGAGSGAWRDDWMHGLIRGVASEAVGLEIDPERVEQARAKGVELVLGDAMKIDLGSDFDVVFAGEVIEHLTSFEGLLGSAARHLRPGGHIVLTTPNAFAISNFTYRLFASPRVNEGHTCWFCETTLRQLLERQGYQVEHMGFIPHIPSTPLRRLATAWRPALPERLAWNTLLAVARVREDHDDVVARSALHGSAIRREGA